MLHDSAPIESALAPLVGRPGDLSSHLVVTGHGIVVS
jgi:hypothetical protein